MKSIRIPRTNPDIGLQIQWIKKYFPQFKYKNYRWRGTLSPRSDSPDYKVEVRYRGSKSPLVFVTEPIIAIDAPHRYLDKSLCLYYPPDWKWSENEIVAQTIIPWTSFWLFCYEYWLEEGEWYGEEAPHPRRKKRFN